MIKPRDAADVINCKELQLDLATLATKHILYMYEIPGFKSMLTAVSGPRTKTQRWCQLLDLATMFGLF